MLTSLIAGLALVAMPAQGGIQDRLLKPGTMAPNFSVKTPEGKTMNLKQTLAKGKGVLLNFWFYT